MLSLDAPTLAQLSASALAPALLYEFDFVQGTQYVTSWNDALTIGGNTYTPLGGNISVSNFSESEDSSVDKLTVKFPLTNLGLLALVIGTVENYRGRQARIYLQLLSSQFVPVGSKVLRFSGYMEPASVSRESSPDQSGGDGQGSQGDISVQLSKSGLVRSRNYEGLRITDQQQRSRFPGDTSFEYVKALQDTPSQWLSKNFQRV